MTIENFLRQYNKANELLDERYLHTEDLDRNSALINAFSEVIKYYGDK